MILREILTRLGYDLDPAGQKKAEAGFATLVKMSAAVVAGIGAISVGLVAIAKSTADAGDHIRDSARKTGLGVEAYQELGFAAKQSGVEVGLLEQGLRFLQVNAIKAAQGGKEASAAYALLGVKVKGSDGQIRPSADLFEEVATKIANIDNPAKRTAAAIGIFGRSGASLLPLLLEGGEGIRAMRARAQELGFVMSKEATEASDTFNDSLNELGMSVEGIKRRLGVQLLPVLTRIVASLTDLIVKNRTLIDRSLRVVAGLFVAVAEAGIKMADAISDNLRFLTILASMLTAFLIPSVYGYASAWIAANAAQIAALAVPALMGAAFLALAAIIALVIEDVYTFVSGGKSLLGDLFSAFLDAPSSPNDHWLVQWMRIVLRGMRAAITGLSEFFDGFFQYALESGGIWEEFKNGFGVAVEYWWGLLKSFVVKASSKVGEIALGLLKIPGLATFSPLVSGALKVAQGAADLASPLRPGFDQGFALAPSPALAGVGGSSSSIGDTALSVSVNAQGATNPAEVARKTAEAVDVALSNHRREIQRAVKSSVLR